VQKTIQIDVSGDVVGLNRPVDVGIVGEAKSTLKALLESVKEYTPPRRENPYLNKYKRLEER
jgi:acetolactate synthase-1/2/3 large subunit